MGTGTGEPLSPEVLRRAAAHRDAPARLLRAADAVLEGKFSWQEVADGTTDHPLAAMLRTPRATETLWPLLWQTEAELAAEEPARPEPPPVPDEQEDHYSQATVLRDSFDLADDRW